MRLYANQVKPRIFSRFQCLRGKLLRILVDWLRGRTEGEFGVSIVAWNAVCGAAKTLRGTIDWLLNSKLILDNPAL